MEGHQKKEMGMDWTHPEKGRRERLPEKLSTGIFRGTEEKAVQGERGDGQ